MISFLSIVTIIGYNLIRKQPLNKTLIFVLFWSYLLIVLNLVVGFPSLSGVITTISNQKSIFSPDIHLIPFADGFHISDGLNIILFIPLGLFLSLYCNLNNIKTVLLIGFSFSLLIEISQMFTLYRASDVNDLITNTTGTVLATIFANKLKNKVIHTNKSIKEVLLVIFSSALISFF